MSRSLCLIIILCLIGSLLASVTLAAEPKSQDGLPPELTIADQPELTAQLATLEGLRNFAQASAPKGGGFLEGLKGMFGGAPKSVAVPAKDIVTNIQFLRGRLVSVSGIYQSLGPEKGQFTYDGGVLRLSLPSSVVFQGMPSEGPKGLPVTVEGMVEQEAGLTQVRATTVSPCAWLVLLRLARVQERLGKYEEAEKTYQDAYKRCQALKSPFAAFALVSAGRVAYDNLRDLKKAKNHYAMAWNPFTPRDRQGKPNFYTWVPRSDGTGWDKLGVAQAIKEPLDAMNRTGFWYKFMAFFVALAGGQHWLGIVLVAIISRVVIWPLTKKQLASAQSMQRLQPQIKALQDKYTDDKNKFNEEFWKLCQANGVNPMGGCLPMLVQFPILIALWRGIRDYIVQFDGHAFLWVHNLAAPDTALLVAYTISMIFFQKMTQKLQPTPTMNPQQAQQQQMMTYMMPLMFFFFFQGFPAAFLLYWLATNIVYFVQQYAYTHQSKRQPEVVGSPVKSGGFANSMVKMLSAKGEAPEDTPAEERKSFHEREAEARGKKAGKTDEPDSRKRGHK
jgi:YidC/Oxa1 family membrane protein insertase